MGFDQEWAGARADASERQAVAMRLNRADDGPGAGPGAAGPPDQASTPATKKAAANTIETELEPNTGKAATWADVATDTAITGFAGWATAVGLKTVQTTWDSQVKTLTGRLTAEKGALRATATTVSNFELDRKQRFSGLQSGIGRY
ncbi:hypothetical protein ACIHCQ_11080 [Streptomyces sp. NPDC052236]|uniref:hypothetical protein n=1 Tax=Streptomyces sp. NPDC052236 TaxID=3365686 RepID=UPI0037D61937